jgi:hypothetical protein
MVRILDAKPLGDPLKLLSPRIIRREMTLHVVEQAGHLAKEIVIRRQVEEVSFSGVEVAFRPLDQWTIAEDSEPSVRFQWIDSGRLSGRSEVTMNRRL